MININKIVTDTLSHLNIPIRYRSYSGSKRQYITFFEVNNSEEDYSDDMSETEVFSLQVDLWSKDDPTQLKRLIKKALKSKFYYVNYQDVSVPNLFHIAFRCYYYNYEESE